MTPNLETLSLKFSDNLVELCMPVTCQKLKHLDISRSKLRTFDLGLTPNLETLFLNNCGDFEELHMSVACPNLKFLNLSLSGLRSLDLELIPNLESLDLAGCYELVEINAPVGCLKKVVHLNLSGCALLEKLPEDIGRSECLKELDITDMECSRRMIQLWEEGEKKVLNKLKFLFLSGSNLTIFDIRITPNLEMLSLNYSLNLKELCMPAASCQKLNYLHISHSKLRTFDLGLTPNLEKLSLSGCADFVELHVSVACPNLKFLNLSLLGLRSLDLELIPNLERLDLKNCDELVEINAPVGCLKKVVRLNLSGCELLEKLPEDIGGSECLEELDIRDTGISHLPQSIIGLKGLLIAASSELLQLYDFPSEIKTTTSPIPLGQRWVLQRREISVGDLDIDSVPIWY